MFRPAKLGRDPRYGPSDPAHTYIPDLTETFHGPLAAALGVDGLRASVDSRTKLYAGLDPFGGGRLLTGGTPHNYRPVVGGNFHATKTLDVWLANLPEVERMRAERLFAECCLGVVKARVLPDEVPDGGTPAAGQVPADAMAVLFLHGTNGAGDYHCHVLVEVHNAGRGPDGVTRTVDSTVLFANQGRYSLEAEARVMRAFHERYGLVLRPDGRRNLEVAGLEAARGVPTRRQEQIRGELDRLKLPALPKNVDPAARATRRPRDPGLTVAGAAKATRRWFGGRGVDARRAVVDLRRPSALTEEKRAESAVVRAVVAAQRLGARFSLRSLHTLALRHALDLRADPARLSKLLNAFAKFAHVRERFGVFPAGRGLFTTERVERFQADLAATLDRVAKGGRAVSGGTLPSAGFLRTLLAPVPAGGGRVFAAAGPASRDALESALGTRVELPEALAARLADVPTRGVFVAAGGDRAAAVEKAKDTGGDRYPKLTLTPNDVLVLDVRNAAARAAAYVAREAEQAGCRVVLVGRVDPPVPRPDRDRERGHGPS